MLDGRYALSCLFPDVKRYPHLQCKHPSIRCGTANSVYFQVGATLLGIAGGGMLALGSSGTAAGPQHDVGQVGLSGDIASLIAAIAMVGYLSAGRQLRQW